MEKIYFNKNNPILMIIIWVFFEIHLMPGAKVGERGRKAAKVGESRRKVAKGGERWRKAAKGGERWRKPAKGSNYMMNINQLMSFLIEGCLSNHYLIS